MIGINLDNNLGFLERYLSYTDDYCHHIIYGGYNHVAQSVTPALTACFTLVVILYGIALWRGSIDASIQEAGHKLLKIAVGIACIRYWGFFSEHFALILTQGPDELAGLVMGAFGHGDITTTQNLSHQAQVSFDQAIGLIADLLKTWSPSIIVSATIMFIVILVLFGYAITLLMIAKLGLAVLLVLAPVFILLSWFKTTEGISQAALRNALSFALTPAFISAALMVSTGILDYGFQLAQLQQAEHKSISFDTATVIIVGGILCIPLLLQMKNLAGQIAGGFALSTQGAVGQAYRRFIDNPVQQLSRQLKQGMR